MEPTVQRAYSPSLLRLLLIGRRPKFTMIRIVVFVALIFLIRHFAILPIRSLGPSMLPTYQDHGVNFVNRLAYLRHEPRRGDVVAIRTSGESVMYMKRVVGLPGETIFFQQGRAYIDGKPLEEPYVIFPCDWNLPPTRIEPGTFFVVGDNRSMPSNYHYFGATERRRIVGKILLCKNLFASSVPSR